MIPLPDLEGEWHYLDEWYRDKVGTVTSFRPDNSGRQIITAEFQSRMKPDDTIAWDFYEWKPADGHTLTVSTDDGVRAAAQEEIETLRRELARANERVEEFRRRESLMRSDWTAYTSRIMEEANERDWCGEYDRIMEEIQGSLNILVIPERDEDVDIEWEETYTVTDKRSGTARLHSGYDSDDIDRAARDLNGDSDATQEEILRAVRDGEYESHSFVNGSAEEA